jgi:rSAM/selenodomain-associated transferase 1
MNSLIIFVKNPELGHVKTRIAKTAGDKRALQIYIELMKHTRKIALTADTSRLLFYSQEINRVDDWSNEDFQKHLQVETDLGGRMTAAFAEGFKRHDKVVIIGSDCASLTPEIVQEAFDALDKNDFVVGPTFDGGYYLLGMRSFQPTVFENVEWSTESVFPTTIERINALNATYHLTEHLSDIDFEEDWIKYGWEIEGE